MAQKKNRLGLNWTNQDKSLCFDLDGNYEWVNSKDPRVSEPRILVEKQSYGDEPENLLIHGDNLLALKALLPEYRGKVKVIYIDPPFNTGSAFEHYEDGYEHSLWLTIMRDRLRLLNELLSEEGAIFVHLDYHELHYMKVMLDSIFGREQFVSQITVKTKSPSGFKTVNRGVFESAEYILCYAKPSWEYKPQFAECEHDTNYDSVVINPGDPADKWRVAKISDVVAKRLGKKSADEAKKDLGTKAFMAEMEEFALKNNKSVFRLTEISDSAAGRATVEAKRESLKHPSKVLTVERKNYSDRYILGGKEITFYSKKFKKLNGKEVPTLPLTEIWTDIPWEGIASEGGVRLKKGKKPERLLRRIIDMASEHGDLVLDSFAGSGTTGAVAQKMGRNWIMVELGAQANTMCKPRLKSVTDGSDQTGISKIEKWKGGGGFKFLELGPSLFSQDEDLKMTVLNPQIFNGELIRAVLKLEGFAPYRTDNSLHGVAGRVYAHVTEQFVTQQYLDAVLNEVEASRSLVVYAKSYSSAVTTPENVELKRMPDVLLEKFSL